MEESGVDEEYPHESGEEGSEVTQQEYYEEGEQEQYGEESEQLQQEQELREDCGEADHQQSGTMQDVESLLVPDVPNPVQIHETAMERLNQLHKTTYEKLSALEKEMEEIDHESRTTVREYQEQREALNSQLQTVQLHLQQFLSSLPTKLAMGFATK